MSEYQYYEFQAIDHPLTDDQQEELRGISSRAHITATGFVNVYNYGDLRARPADLLAHYFDAFCYVSNWGSRQLMFRIPSSQVNEEMIRPYCLEDVVSLQRKGDFHILAFTSESEEYEWEEGEGWLSSMITLREDLIRGDYRCLYIAWLLGVQQELMEDETEEPPVPDGMDELNGPLSTFVRFMRIDPDLVTVGARSSRKIPVAGRDQAVRSWIQDMDADEKNEILFRLVSGTAPNLGAELYQRFLRSSDGKDQELAEDQRRTAGELLAQVESCARERQKREAAERARREAVRRERLAREREKYLAGLAGREEELWQQVHSLIADKRPADYDRAVQLLRDLRTLAGRAGEGAAFRDRLGRLIQEHRRKYSLIRRLEQAGLSG